MPLMPFEIEMKNKIESRVADELGNMQVTVSSLEEVADILDRLEDPLKTPEGIQASKDLSKGLQDIELNKKRIAEYRGIVGYYLKKDILV